MASGDGRISGSQDVAAWERLNEWMVTTGQLEKSADVTGAVSNDYLAAE